MGKLHGDDSGGCKQDFHAGDKIVDVRDVRQNVVAQQQVGANLSFDHVGCGGFSEKLRAGGNSMLLDGNFGDVFGRLDAQHVDAPFLEILQEIAVVAGDLDDT